MTFHWWDFIPILLFILLIGALILVGWSIGVGYAWMQRRREQHPDIQ